MPGRVSVTIDGTKFSAVDAVFSMGTNKDAAGMPVLQTLTTTVHVRVDLNDDTNFPYSNIEKVFKLGNVPDREKIKEMKVEFWKDDRRQDVICSYKFKGWISMFRTSNQANGTSGFNHLLDLELTPIVNTQNHQEVTISN